MKYNKNRNIYKKLIILIIVIICIVLFYNFTPLKDMKWFANLMINIREKRCAPLIYMLLLIAASMLFVPVTWMFIIGGMIFGCVYGLMYSWLASFVACNLSFLLGRFLGKTFIDKIMMMSPMNVKFMWSYIQTKIAKHRILYMILLRNIPVIPFAVLNYCAGISSIPFHDYLIGSAVGMIPITFVTVYFSNDIIPINNNYYGLVIFAVITFVTNITAYFYSKKCMNNVMHDENDIDKLQLSEYTNIHNK